MDIKNKSLKSNNKIFTLKDIFQSKLQVVELKTKNYSQKLLNLIENHFIGK